MSFEKDSKGCEHVQEGLCVGMAIAIPPSFLEATILGQKFGVPFCTALHQRFCIGDDHEGCF
jgi:hypothetical protein